MTTLAPLARCTFKGCPVRFTSPGPDHPCRDHGAEDWAVSSAARELGISLDAIPGEYGDRDGDADGRRRMAGELPPACIPSRGKPGQSTA